MHVFNLQMAASSSSSSSSSSESEDSDSRMTGPRQKGRSLPQLPALARLAATAPPAAQPSSVSDPAAARLRAPVGAPSSPRPAVTSADRPAATAPAEAGSPAAAEPELAAVLRLRETPGTQQSAGAALLREATSSSTATSTAAGRDADSSNSSQHLNTIAADPRSNIVTAPVPPAARVEVCQGKSCAKRGAADLLRQASAAGAGRPGVQVSGCKCLGKCKQGPAVRVRSGRERPTVLTQVRESSVFAGHDCHQ